jgi:DegT/DnrJ/EryC1/StrS aminotransferase family
MGCAAAREFRSGIMCAHRKPAYQSQLWRSAGPLSESERVQEECILLPLHHQLTKEEQELIARIFERQSRQSALGEPRRSHLGVGVTAYREVVVYYDPHVPVIA